MGIRVQTAERRGKRKWREAGSPVVLQEDLESVEGRLADITDLIPTGCAVLSQRVEQQNLGVSEMGIAGV